MLTLATTLPDVPALSGTSLFLQAGFVDPGAVVGASRTAGLELAIG